MTPTDLISSPDPSYNKLCALEDFAKPAVRQRILECLPGALAEDPDFPRRREHRKMWEVAMAARSLTDFGVLHADSEVLGVGAGNEGTIFWLTTRVRRVFATDLYLAPGVWEREASASMLMAPERHAPCPWNPRRLVVQHMNALNLKYEDESFDGIFSSSSIEHFGTAADVRQAAEEMFRVLKPGGLLSLSTEFRLKGPPPGLLGVLLFDRRDLFDLIVEAGDWELVSELDLSVSAETLGTERDYQDVLRGIDGFPHIILREGERVWTSVHLALRRPE